MSCNNDLKSDIIDKFFQGLCETYNCDNIEDAIHKQQEEFNKKATEFFSDLDYMEHYGRPTLYIITDGSNIVSANVSKIELEPEIEEPTISELLLDIGKELSMSFEMEIQPCMEEQLQELREFHIKVIKDVKPDGILVKRKYSQPPYRERMHPKNVVVFRRCRIRNRPNSGHGFKK